MTGHGEMAALLVEDGGAGSSREHAGELFGAFPRAHVDAELPGTGLGLAIVAKIVHRHAGAVRAKGKAGRETTVFFSP